ncbi:DUF2259 domain-containing protein [Pelagibacterium lacus]|uniref:DUF2259 domain-containing protein n=1 Tax=Pelagibacterium lacus TaxID=2282655 RepID=UPI001314A2C6|nr:DUF2259 domain-containing protein [Pelagibacterium lacus]
MAQTDLDRRGWLASAVLALGLCATGGAVAAERAQFDAIGYSEDGRYFAFEQFGIQDGSGFPYSEIAIIDLDTDRFAGGSPFRARIDTEMAALGEARDAAHAAAQKALTELAIDRPAIPIALRGDGEAAGDEGLALDYAIPIWGLDGTEGDYRLSLEIFKAPSTQDCDWFEGDPMGYRLIREIDGERAELHSDSRVPASRGCVITYKFYGVMLPFNAFDNGSAVAVLSYWSHGFEGPDRRFLALPVGDR